MWNQFNEMVYRFAVSLDSQIWSTMLHESYYMYSWVESTHVLALMLSLGLLALVDLRMLGYALPEVPASQLAARLRLPMLLGFGVMFITGILLFYAIPVRTAQSVWFRLKVLLLIASAVNALLFHRNMARAGRVSQVRANWDKAAKAPRALRIGAGLSLTFWALVVICGRFIAYDWYDCQYATSPLVQTLAGCIAEQTQF